jgi:hypothetical protein
LTDNNGFGMNRVVATRRAQPDRDVSRWLVRRDGERATAGDRRRQGRARGQFLALEVDLAVIADRPQYGEVFAKAGHLFAGRDAKSTLFQLVSAEPDSEAEVAVRGGLGGLCRGGDQQRMAGVDRNDGGADTEAAHRGGDHRRQGERVDVKALIEPHLAHAAVKCAGSL